MLDENFKETNKGEMFIVPPIMGLSNTLLNKNHYNVYYKGLPKFKNKILRRHGDELEQLYDGYYRAHGRVDDAMNLGGIKVSSIQIEEVINQLDFIKESAAIAISPKGGGSNKLVIYYVQNHANSSKDERLYKVKQIIKSKINPLFKVSDLIFLDKLPRTASGKIMRRNLRDDYNLF